VTAAGCASPATRHPLRAWLAWLGVLAVVAVGCGGPAHETSASGATRAGAGGLTTASDGEQPPSSTPSGVAKVAGPARSHVDPQRPRSLILPSGTRVPVDVASTDASGVLALPEDVDQAGWWDGSAMIGDVLGSVVVAAHVDSFDQGLGAFAELLSSRPGQSVQLTSKRWRQTYRITTAHLVPKASLDATSPLYTGRKGRPLVLITCGGAYDPARGGYQDNFVVVADPVGPVRQRIS
jgi:hypothetical protein